MIGAAGGELFGGATSSVTISRAASRAAPPQKKDSTWAVLGVLFCLILVGLGILAIVSSPPQVYHPPRSNYNVEENRPSTVGVGVALIIMGALLVALPIAAIKSNERWNSKTYGLLLSGWARSWMCRSCSWIFVPDGEGSAFLLQTSPARHKLP
jgi:hypothetical protein